jgi:protein TonB
MKLDDRRRSRMPETSLHTNSDPAHSTPHELHVLADRPVEVHFQFERPQSRVGIGASIGAHIVMGLIALAILNYVPSKAVFEPPPDLSPDRLVWLVSPGPGGGGGGGGNKAPEPPRKAELPGKAKMTVPVAPPAPAKPAERKKEEPPAEDLTIPVKTLASAEQTLPGVIESANLTAETTSQGAGSNGGAGTGSGAGIGSGQGSGLGPGYGGGAGGGAYRPGSGITIPRVVREIKPQYTAEAMRAKVQGLVWIECVVMPDGSVGDVKVIRSLDPVFGLDQEAVKAARQWRFMPGTRQGEPVPVIITIELTFTLR